MLVPFAIDVDSLNPDQAWTPAQQRACHKSLLDVWKRIGLLAYDGSTFDGSRLKQAVSQLPQSLRPLWQEVLERVPLAAVGPGWNGTVSPATIQGLAAIQLAIVDDTRAEVEFGFPDDCDEQTHLLDNGQSVDVCRMLTANHARAFVAAIEQSGTHVEIGTTFQSIWDCRFKSLASAPIKQISIVDRYAIERHHEPSAQSGLSGLERFIRLLDAGATGPRHVTLYSTWTERFRGKSIDDVADELRPIVERLSAKNIKRIKIHMVPNTGGFRDDGHDRFVRFGDYVWDIGLGLEIFEGAFSSKKSSASFKSGAAVASYRQVEQDLSTNAGTKSKEINL